MGYLLLTNIDVVENENRRTSCDRKLKKIYSYKNHKYYYLLM